MQKTKIQYRFKTILCLFDYKCNTGFGTVSKNIVKQLRKQFGNKLRLEIVAINYHGDLIQEDANTTVVSAMRLTPDKKDTFGRIGFLDLLDKSNYDGIFIMQDIGLAISMVEVLEQIKLKKLRENRKIFKSLLYFPIDASIIFELTRGLDFYDVLITYTNYGREEVLRHAPHLRKKMKVINHGNDNAVFYPVSRASDELREFREKYFMLGDEESERFIFTTVNRNQPRKDIPATILAFVEAKKSWPKHLRKPFLYIHAKPQDQMSGIQCHDLRALMKSTDLVEMEDYMFIPGHMEDYAATVDDLRMIYNASDAFITTTRGEGWGLSITEAMACRCPVIAPMHTSITEISGNGTRLYGLESVYPIVNQMDNVIRYQVDLTETADMMIEVAREVDLCLDTAYDKMANAYKFVLSIDWHNIGVMFAEQFDNLFHISVCSGKIDGAPPIDCRESKIAAYAVNKQNADNKEKQKQST